jgi:hypothetical protein
MIVETKPLIEVSQTAIRLLCKELGVVNTARFLNQYSQGFGNYTEERDQIIGKMTVEEIIGKIRSQESSQGLDEP